MDPMRASSSQFQIELTRNRLYSKTAQESPLRRDVHSAFPRSYDQGILKIGAIHDRSNTDNFVPNPTRPKDKSLLPGVQTVDNELTFRSVQRTFNNIKKTQEKVNQQNQQQRELINSGVNIQNNLQYEKFDFTGTLTQKTDQQYEQVKQLDQQSIQQSAVSRFAALNQVDQCLLENAQNLHSPVRFHGQIDFKDNIRGQQRLLYNESIKIQQLQKQEKLNLQLTTQDMVKYKQEIEEMQHQIYAEKQRFGVSFNDYCALGVKASAVQSQLDVLRKRSESEEKQKIQLQSQLRSIAEIQPYLQELHKHFSYRPVQEILTEVGSLEDKQIKSYNQLQMGLDDKMSARAALAEHQQQNRLALAKVQNRDDETIARMQTMVETLKKQRDRLSEDSKQADQAGTRQAKLFAELKDFYSNWTYLFLQNKVLCDQLDVRRLEDDKALNPEKSNSTQLMASLNRVLQSIFTLNLQRYKLKSGIQKNTKNLVFAQNKQVLQTPAGRSYRNVALLCNEIQRDLFSERIELRQNIPAIAREICSGTVKIFDRKEQLETACRIFQQEIEKLKQVEGKVDVWQFAVVQQLKDIQDRFARGFL